MPWGLQKDEEDSNRLVLCEVDAGCEGEANELAHLLFKLSQLSKRLEHQDCSLHQHITKKIQKTKADIIETFLYGIPTPEFVGSVVYRIRRVQRSIERFENRHSPLETSRENSGHEYLSYVVQKVSNDNYRLKKNKKETVKSQKPTPFKTRKWDRKYKTKRSKTVSDISFNKPETEQKYKEQKPKPSNSKESVPAQEKKTVKEVYETQPKTPVRNVSQGKTLIACQSCKCCYLKKFQKDHADKERAMQSRSICKLEKNMLYKPNAPRLKEMTGVCTIVPSRTSVISRNKPWAVPDPRCSYKILKRCPGLYCPIHNRPKELKKNESGTNEPKKDSVLCSAKAFAKTIAGRGAAFISPLQIHNKKCIPVNIECETDLYKTPSPRCALKQNVCKTQPSEKPVTKSTATLKFQSVDRATSYERFYINPLGLADKNSFRPVENKLINEEWRYFGDDYPLKLDKIEHFRGEGVEYTIKRPVDVKAKLDIETQTSSRAPPKEYKVANMNIVYSKTHLKYIVPGWKESSAETVSTPKILCKKKLDDGLAVTTYKMDPDGTVYFTLAYSTDTADEVELNAQHSENHLSKLKSVKDVWVQSARHLYDSLRTTYSTTSSHYSSH